MRCAPHCGAWPRRTAMPWSCARSAASARPRLLARLVRRRATCRCCSSGPAPVSGTSIRRSHSAPGQRQRRRRPQPRRPASSAATWSVPSPRWPLGRGAAAIRPLYGRTWTSARTVARRWMRSATHGASSSACRWLSPPRSRPGRWPKSRRRSPRWAWPAQRPVSSEWARPERARPERVEAPRQPRRRAAPRVSARSALSCSESVAPPLGTSPPIPRWLRERWPRDWPRPPPSSPSASMAVMRQRRAREPRTARLSRRRQCARPRRRGYNSRPGSGYIQDRACPRRPPRACYNRAWSRLRPWPRHPRTHRSVQ